MNEISITFCVLYYLDQRHDMTECLIKRTVHIAAKSQEQFNLPHIVKHYKEEIKNRALKLIIFSFFASWT